MSKSILKTIELALTPKEAAEAFCNWNDEDQAQFFIEVAKLAEEWPGISGMQWFLVGRHLLQCTCSTDDARELVKAIAQGCEP